MMKPCLSKCWLTFALCKTFLENTVRWLRSPQKVIVTIPLMTLFFLGFTECRVYTVMMTPLQPHWGSVWGCLVLLTRLRGWGKWARGKRRGSAALAPEPPRHRSRTRAPQDMSFSEWLVLSGTPFPLHFPNFLKSDISSFWNRSSLTVSNFRFRVEETSDVTKKEGTPKKKSTTTIQREKEQIKNQWGLWSDSYGARQLQG